MPRCRSWWNCVKCILWVFTIEFAGPRSPKSPQETSFLKLVSGWLHCHWAEQRELYSRRKLNKFEWFPPSDIRTQSHSRLCIYTYIPRVQSSRPHIFPVFPPLSLSLCRDFLFSNKNCAYYASPDALEASLQNCRGEKIGERGRCFLSCSHSTQRNSVRTHSCQVAETKNRAPKQQQRNRYGDGGNGALCSVSGFIYSGYYVECIISKKNVWKKCIILGLTRVHQF